MNPWLPKAVILFATIVMIAIRAPHGQRSRTVVIAKNRKGRLETAMLTLVWLGLPLPLIWITTPWLSFAEYPLRPASFLVGVILLAAGLWLLYRSHADLGTNWSVTLQIREKHRLITQGIYRRVRHPMYLSLFLYSVGQILALPNWVAGPSYLVT